MTEELNYLLLTGLLSILLWTPYIVNRMFLWGIGGFLHNYPEGFPKTEPTPPEWAQRAKRAHLNLVENLPAFAIAVLVAHQVSPGAENVILWAKVFFFSRIVYTLAYTLALPFVRTPLYLVGWFSILMIGLGIL